MVRKKAGGEALQSARKRVIKEMQAAIARELAAQSEVPKSMPQRIADLVRELHRRLREASQTRDTTAGHPRRVERARGRRFGL
jgi:hypothetical protein